MRLVVIGLGLTVAVATAACTSLLGDYSDGPSGADAGPSEDATGDVTTTADSQPAADAQTHVDTGVDSAPPPADASMESGGDGSTCANTLCGTDCTDTMTDPQHCGGCSTDCTMLAHVASSTGVTCSAGKCVIPAADCQAGYAHCSANASDGCETAISSSQSCGSCTTMCTGSTALCQLDSTTMTYGCVSSCSGATPTLCGSSCTNIDNGDPANCGGCSMPCPAVTGGGVATCTNQACGVSCNAGEHQCNTSTMCANDTDINNCGATCVTCTAPGSGSVACTGGACVPSCSGGASVEVCGGNCVDTSSDPSYCGNCTTACSAPLSACIGSACACPATTPTFCSTTSTCVNTTNDGANCGTCGHSCLGGTCSAGKCQPVTVYTESAFQATAGLYGMAILSNSPPVLAVVNCDNGGAPMFNLPATVPATTPTFGAPAGAASYCGRNLFYNGGGFVYFGTDNGASNNGAMWYVEDIGSLGTVTRMDTAGSITANIVQVAEIDYPNLVQFTTTGTTNNLCNIAAYANGAAPTCITLAASGVHGLAAGASSNLYVAAPTQGYIYLESISGTSFTGSAWLTSGGGAPYDLQIPGDGNIYWSDHANGAFYRSSVSSASPTSLTTALPNGRIPAIEVPDGFFVDTTHNLIYFWNRTSGNIWTIATNGTSSAMSLVAANPNGVGSVTTNSTAIFWSVDGTTPLVKMLAE